LDAKGASNRTETQRGRRWFTPKAVITGLAATVLFSFVQNVGWIEFPPDARMDISGGSMPGVAGILITLLVGTNLLFRKLGLRRWVFNQGEIAWILATSLVAVLVGGRAGVRQLPTGLLTPFHQSRPENKWGALVTDYLPEWFLPKDLRKRVGRYDEQLTRAALGGILGGGPVPVLLPVGTPTSAGPEIDKFVPKFRTDRRYVTDQSHPRYQELFSAFFGGAGQVTWGVWVRPLLVWGGYSVVLYLTLLCFMYLAQGQWVDRERLAFPILAAPLEIIRDGGNRRLFSSRFFRIGFCVALAYSIHVFIASLWPSFPQLRLFVDLRSFLVNKPWNAILLFLLAFDLGAFAFLFIMPKDITFSFWVFHLINTFCYVFGSMMGWGAGNPQGPVAMLRWPFYGEVGFGAFAGVLFVAAWTGRRHARRAVQTALGRPGHSASVDEPASTRVAVWGLVLGVGALLAFAVAAGMRPNLAGLFFGLLFIYFLSIVRVRAESALPAVHGPDFWSGSPDAMFRAAVGTVHADPTSMAVMGSLSWTAVTAATSPMPHMMNAFKLAQQSGIARRWIFSSLALAVVGGIGVNAIFVLRSYYIGGVSGTTAQNLAARVVREAADDARTERPVDVPGLIAVAGSAVFCILLGVMRARFLWWPFHPIGYALGHSFWCSYYWFTAFLAWGTKALVLRYGGAGLHRKLFDLCVGLLAAGWAFGVFTTSYGLLWHKGPLLGDALFRLLF